MSKFTPFAVVPTRRDPLMQQLIPQGQIGRYRERAVNPSVDAIHPVWGPTDLIPEAVKNLTGSDELAFISSFVSPSSLRKAPNVRGITTWHGSPSKFDHEWLVKLPDGSTAYVGGKYNTLKEVPKNATILESYPAGRFREEAALEKEGAMSYGHGAAYLAEAKAVGEEYLPTSGAQGHLYKADIPEEALAYMLDWYKPLSKQPPAVQAVLRQDPHIDQLFKSGTIDEVYWNGGDLYKEMVSAKRYNNPNSARVLKREAQIAVSDDLRQRGLLGAHYPDGSSRQVGGTNNYVVYDPDLIRILERNGVVTGAKPWMPGEYKLPSK